MEEKGICPAFKLTRMHSGAQHHRQQWHSKGGGGAGAAAGGNGTACTIVY